MDDQALQQLKNMSLSAGFSDQQLERFAKLADTITIKRDTRFICEDDAAKNFYILLKGSAVVLKLSEDKKQQHKIADLSAGTPIGAMAFIEDKPRSASVTTLEDSTLLRIRISDIKDQPEYNDIFTQIAINLAKTYSKRLRHTNEVTVKSIQKELDQSKKRVAIGILMVSMFYVLSLYALSLSTLTALKQYLPNTTAISLALIVIVATVLFLSLKKSGYGLQHYGFTTKDWRPACKEAILFTIPFLIFILLLKWIFITFSANPGQAFFSPTGNFSNGTSFDIKLYLLTAMAYAFFCPLQEFIARGALQSSLQMFIGDDTTRQTWFAIILSNLVFAAAHSHTTITFALLVFIPGLFWGWLFSRHRNLISVSISHIMVGVWAIFIVGFPGIF